MRISRYFTSERLIFDGDSRHLSDVTVLFSSPIEYASLLLALVVSLVGCGRHGPVTQSITTINLVNVGVDGKQQFQEIRSKKDLPPEVMKWFAGGIADPGEKYAATDVADSRLPRRRLLVAGRSSAYCIVNYERGGIAHDYVFILFFSGPTNC